MSLWSKGWKRTRKRQRRLRADVSGQSLPLTAIPDDELDDLNSDLLQCAEFNEWFADSIIRDQRGLPLLCYHGTDRDFDSLDPEMAGGGIHFGTLLQANNRLFGLDLENHRPRTGARLIPAYIRSATPKRMREQDSWGDGHLNSAMRAGHDAIIYLNRREGIPFHRFEELRNGGWTSGFGWPKIQKLSDLRFLDLVPEAEDSVIVFDKSQIMPATQAWEMIGKVPVRTLS